MKYIILSIPILLILGVIVATNTATEIQLKLQISNQQDRTEFRRCNIAIGRATSLNGIKEVFKTN